MTNNLAHLNKLATARAAAARVMPYFSCVLVSLVPYEAKGLGTLGVTERCVLLYDPDVVDRWSVDSLGYVLLHEVGHVVRGHHARCKALAANDKLWNLAADAEINDDLTECRLKHPDGSPGVLPKSFGMADGLTAEEYYASLVQQAANAHAAGKKGKKGSPEGPEAEQPDPGKGWCGGAAGRPLPGEQELAEGMDQTLGRTPQELEALKGQVAEAIKQHAREEKNRGNIPAGWLRWADVQLTPPTIPWRHKLARAARRCAAFTQGAVDKRYGKPNRRQSAVGYGVGKPVLSAWVAPVPKVTVAIDTSGSMSEQDLSIGVSETVGVLKAVGAAITFISCDAAVHSNVQITNPKEIIKNLKGGGGTDFVPAFEAVAQAREQCDVLVFVTDLCGRFPEVPPAHTRVIWLATGSYARGQNAPFGETIHVE